MIEHYIKYNLIDREKSLLLDIQPRIILNLHGNANMSIEHYSRRKSAKQTLANNMFDQQTGGFNRIGIRSSKEEFEKHICNPLKGIAFHFVWI